MLPNSGASVIFPQGVPFMSEKSEINEQETSFVTARTPLANIPVASLFFTHGSRAGEEVPLVGETFFIGRSKNNSLVLGDQSVSRKHAVINYLDGRYILSDLNSLKGVYVNGRKIEEVDLIPGDVINIGENRMQFRVFSPSGTWVDPTRKKRSGFLFLFLAVVIGGLAGGAVWYVLQGESSKMPPPILQKIESHYVQGIDYFNRERDVQKARAEWQKILDLDPEKKTDFAIKADKLLKSTDMEKAGE